MNALRIRRPGLIALGLGLSLVLFETAGHAQAPKFGVVPHVPISGEIVVRQALDSRLPRDVFRVNLRPTMAAAWAKARGDLPKRASEEIGKLRWRGLSAYNINLNLAPAFQLKAATSYHDVGLQLDLPGNSLAATMTTPDIAFSIGLGRYADPRFSIAADLQVNLDLRARLTGIEVRQATVQARASRPQGENLPGDVVQGVADIVSFLGGPDFRGLAQKVVNSQQVDMKKHVESGLAGVNKVLRKYASVPNVDVRFQQEGQRLVLEIYKLPQKYQAPDIR